MFVQRIECPILFSYYKKNGPKVVKRQKKEKEHKFRELEKDKEAMKKKRKEIKFKKKKLLQNPRDETLQKQTFPPQNEVNKTK